MTSLLHFPTLLASAVGALTTVTGSAAFININPSGFTNDVVYESGVSGSLHDTFTNEASALFEQGQGAAGAGLPPTT